MSERAERAIEEPIKTVMTLRVAIETFAMILDGLGNDWHGKSMPAAYRARVTELQKIIYGADHA